MKQLSKKLLLLLCAVVSCGAAWAQETVAWVKVTDYSNLSTNDTYVIVGNGMRSNISGTTGTVFCSLKNNESTSNKNLPIGKKIAQYDGQNVYTFNDYIINTFDENDTWKIETTGTSGNYFIKSTKNSNLYLQNENAPYSYIKGKPSSTNLNRAIWKIHYEATNSSGEKVTGLYNVGCSRVLALFYSSSSTNWPCYGPSGYDDFEGAEVVLYRKVTSVPVTISSARYASFCSSCPLNFSGTDITVYKAKGTETAVTLTKVEDGIVPANKGVVLYSADATIQNVPVTTLTGSTDWSDNELIGITERTKISVNGAEGKTNYILSKEDDVVGFYLAASGEGAYLAANRAYLSTSATQQLVPQYLGFEEEITGIQSLTPTLSQGEGDCYDLSGRRVVQPTKGMYIINGRKVYVK